MRRPVELLVAIVLLVGLWPAAMIGSVLHSGVLAVLGGNAPYYSLALWHGFNVALTANGVTVTDFARAADDVTVRALAGDAFVMLDPYTARTGPRVVARAA